MPTLERERSLVILPTKSIDCPYCGETIELIIDDSLDHQEYVEDCAVCCRPINVIVSVAEDSEIHVIGRSDSEI